MGYNGNWERNVVELVACTKKQIKKYLIDFKTNAFWHTTNVTKVLSVQKKNSIINEVISKSSKFSVYFLLRFTWYTS